MAVILVPRSSTGGSGGESGHTHANLSVLNSLDTDNTGNLTVNGVAVLEKAIEKSYEVTLNAQHIADKFIELPEDCDAGRAVTLVLESVPQRIGDDWEVIEKTWPEKDLVSWAGLGMESIVRVKDKVTLTYYAKAVS